ncbi:hypothetical protein T439DRAFT_323247 [Meredithblackwellia eburnea MCA 4105]
MSRLAGQLSPTIPQSRVPALPPPPLAPALSSSTSTLPSSPSPLSGRSTSGASSPVAPPRRPFDGEALRPVIKRTLNRMLNSTSWARDAERARAWSREIGEEIKKKMIELEPSGYKFFVNCSIAERGSGGSSNLATFWDERQDVAISETFINDTLFCSVLAVAVRYG